MGVKNVVQAKSGGVKVPTNEDYKKEGQKGEGKKSK